MPALQTRPVAAALLAPAWSPGLKPANAYADARPGTVAFAVRTDKRVWGRDLTMFMGKSIHDALGIAEDNKFRLAYMASKYNGEPIAFSGR